MLMPTMRLGTGLPSLPTSNGLVKVNVHIRLWFPSSNTVSSLDSILTESVNYHEVLQNKLCNILRKKF